jgi:hypothetical protein
MLSNPLKSLIKVKDASYIDAKPKATSISDLSQKVTSLKINNFLIESSTFSETSSKSHRIKQSSKKPDLSLNMNMNQDDDESD